MRPIDPRRAAAAAWLLLLAGCAAPAGPRPIAHGTPCARCGMEVRDLRFACERAEGRDWRVYDAIECLLADPPTPASGRAYLSDYDRQTLHAAESLWVVQGEFASPMGGGLAAFMSLAAADSIAAVTRGRVNRLTGFAPPPATEAR
jgi:nitrous oxide reductase accessory protein NosL